MHSQMYMCITIFRHSGKCMYYEHLQVCMHQHEIVRGIQNKTMANKHSGCKAKLHWIFQNTGFLGILK